MKFISRVTPLYDYEYMCFYSDGDSLSYCVYNFVYIKLCIHIHFHFLSLIILSRVLTCRIFLEISVVVPPKVFFFLPEL